MFSCRKAGATFSQIAAILNSRGTPTPGSKTVRGGKYWRASALWRILQNPIYKGAYVVNFGSKRGEASGGTRLMPELALVSAEEWEACQRVGRRNGGATSGVVVEQLACRWKTCAGWCFSMLCLWCVADRPQG